MEWIEVGSWIIAALLLASAQVWTRKQHVPNAFGVFASGMIGAVLGGVFAHLVLAQPLYGARYSFAALIAALLFAEVGILMALAIRSGQSPPLAGG